MIGKIERLPIRDVWKHEAHDFTKWLCDNLDVLNDVLDFSLTDAKREHPAGDFNVDLVAHDEYGNQVIIENQFGKSDHDHLGKLVTYTSALDAKRAVWVVGEARPEHIQAITTLNESKTIAYYMVKLEGISIADSPPAPLFTLIVGPTEEGQAIGDLKKAHTESENTHKRFWAQLLSVVKGKTQLHANITPSTCSWISAGAGKTGLVYNYVVLKHEAFVELYIDGGKQSEESNKKVFDTLEKSKQTIDSTFGGHIDWQRLSDKRACRIKAKVASNGLADTEKWPQTHEAMVNAMIRFEKALAPHIQKLR